MRRLLSILVVVISFMFLTGCAISKSNVVSAAQVASEDKPNASAYYPDTSNLDGCSVNLVDLQNKLKYKLVHINRFENMFVTYHEGINGTTPKYVSLLVDGARQKTVGICYYDNGTFRVWMMPIGKSKFDKFKVDARLIKLFASDFKSAFGVEFPVNKTV